MIELDEVIKELTRQINASSLNESMDIWINWKLADEILALLKELKPVQPEYGGDMEGEYIREQEYPECGTWWYECGNCRTPIDYHDRFCRYCGRPVKWEWDA